MSTIRKRVKNKSIKKMKGGKFPTDEELGNDNSESKDVLIYYSLGLGCNGINLQRVKEDVAEITGILLENVLIICHKNSSAIKSIIQTYSGNCPLINSNFIRGFTNSVKKNVKIYKKIFLFGHSFGGAIINRVAEELNKSLDDSYLEKIQFATFGSIYISKAIPRINIFNYMAIGDVASKCNGIIIDPKDIELEKAQKLIDSNTMDIDLKYKKHSDYNIITCCFYNNNEPACLNMKKSVFGNNAEWIVHNKYNILIYYLFRNLTNDIDKVLKNDVDRVQKYDYSLDSNSIISSSIKRKRSLISETARKLIPTNSIDI